MAGRDEGLVREDGSPVVIGFSLPKFTQRELRLIDNCIQYARGAPAGLPGHNLMLIVANLAEHLRMRGVDLVLDDSVRLENHGS